MSKNPTTWTEPEDPRVAIDILTPVDRDCAAPLIDLLTQHGAEIKPLDSFIYWVEGEERTAMNHKIVFPEGTIRYDGLVWSTSRRFRIVFPDGFELRGMDQWGMINSDKTLIFLPKNSG